jgi:hypothetical protein
MCKGPPAGTSPSLSRSLPLTLPSWTQESPTPHTLTPGNLHSLVLQVLCVCVGGGGERERERERDTDETYAASKQDSNAAHHLVRVPVRVPDVYLMRSSALNLAHLAHFLSGFFGCPGTQENLTTKYQVPSTKSYLFANSNGHLRLSMACSSTSMTLTPVAQ